MSAKLSHRLLLVLSAIFIVTIACSLPTRAQETPPENLAQTQAVQTLDVLMTEVAGKNATATPGGAIPTHTSQAPNFLPTSPPPPTATTAVLPTPTITQVCDQAGFIADVTVPDGTTLPSGTQFEKTWRLRNTGSCTWTPDYAIVHESGDSLADTSAKKIGVSVPPGQTVDVSVTMKAPGSPGDYREYWKMRNAAGVIFGVGRNPDRIYVDIKVISITPASGKYDFAASYCAGEWTGNDKGLPCLGTDGNADGFVLQKTNPILETGYVDDQLALITNPPKVNDGVIRGKFPVYTVGATDHFKSLIGCEHNAKSCSVRFQLDYQIDNGSIQTLAAWNESYDESFQQVDVDLSSLAGKNVRFILTVLANGASDNDRAQWLYPRIDKP